MKKSWEPTAGLGFAALMLSPYTIDYWFLLGTLLIVEKPELFLTFTQFWKTILHSTRFVAKSVEPFIITSFLWLARMWSQWLISCIDNEGLGCLFLGTNPPPTRKLTVLLRRAPDWNCSAFLTNDSERARPSLKCCQHVKDFQWERNKPATGRFWAALM